MELSVKHNIVSSGLMALIKIRKLDIRLHLDEVDSIIILHSIMYLLIRYTCNFCFSFLNGMV
jgi:hypothetical protein